MAKLVRVFAPFAIVGLILPSNTVGQVGESSAMFRNGATHPGSYSANGPDIVGRVAWKFQTQGVVRSSPVVFDGVLYVGSGDGHLYALDAVTGDELWRFDAESPVHSSPAVDQDLVYLANFAGRVFAVDRVRGSAVWSVQTGETVPWEWGGEDWDFFLSSPTVVGEILVIGSGDGNVYAFDRLTGNERWRFETQARVRSTPAVADGTVYVGSMDGSLYSIDLATGTQEWRFDTEGRSLSSVDFGFDRKSLQSSPTVSGNSVYIGSREGFMYAVDRTAGTLRWRFDHEVSWANTTAAVSDGVLYAGTSDGLFVHAVDEETGNELWRTTTAGRVFGSPSLAGNNTYVADQSGILYVLSRTTGEVRSQFRLGAGSSSSPVVTEGLVFIGADDGGVYALEGTDKAPRLAVYWDSTASDRAPYAGHEALRTYFVARGYEVLDGDALASFMSERMEDGAPSVVVFTMGEMPETVAMTPSDTTLFTRYLKEGGKVVWIGPTPFFYTKDSETGRVVGYDAGAVGQLLGVGSMDAHFDALGSHSTADGTAWGLERWWVTDRSHDLRDGIVPLALNETGAATVWVRQFHERRGSGYVSFWTSREAMFFFEDLLRITEYGVVR